MLTEKTLDQILGVLELTSNYCESGLPVPKAYQKSVKDIANKYSVRYQTIADGCRRRLNLDNINEFIDLLNKWLGGSPDQLKKLLLNNVGNLDEYKVENFFDQNRTASTQPLIKRNVEESFEAVTFKTTRSIASQLRSLADAEGKSVQDYMNYIIQDHVDKHYVEYVKKLVSSLPASHREKVITDLTNSLK